MVTRNKRISLGHKENVLSNEYKCKVNKWSVSRWSCVIYGDGACLHEANVSEYSNCVEQRRSQEKKYVVYVGGVQVDQNDHVLYIVLHVYYVYSYSYVCSLQYNQCGYNNNIYNHHQYLKHEYYKSKSNVHVYVQYN